jgi:hypothetical protein
MVYILYISQYNKQKIINRQGLASPMALSPVKPVFDYLEDAARLQGAIVSFGSSITVQKRTFQLTSICGYDTAEELARVLTSKGHVRLDVRPDDPVWQGFGRIRMSRAR